MKTALHVFLLTVSLLVSGCTEPQPEQRLQALESAAPVDTAATRKLKKKAWIQASLGNYRDAITEVSAVLRRDPRDAEAYFMRFRFTQQVTDEPFTRQAVQDLREAAALGHPEARDILRRYVDY
ncbi:hypothetical protein LLH00_08595 [bacterium]|nr:hypothetical protein [bacterium]